MNQKQYIDGKDYKLTNTGIGNVYNIKLFLYVQHILSYFKNFILSSYQKIILLILSMKIDQKPKNA